MRKILILLVLFVLSSSALQAQDAVHQFELGSNPRLLKFSPNNKLLLALNTGVLRVAELDTGNVVDINFDVSSYRVSFMDISLDSQYALVSFDTEIYLVDLVSYIVMESYSNDNMIVYPSFVLDGVGFVTHSLGLKFWNIADGSSFLLTSQTNCSFPCIVDLSNGKEFLYVGETDTIYRYNIEENSHTEIFSLENPTMRLGTGIRNVPTSQGIRGIYLTGDDTQLLLDIGDRGRNLSVAFLVLSLETETISGYFPPNGHYRSWVLADAQNTIVRWYTHKLDFVDIRTGKSLHTFELQGQPRKLALSPDGSLVAIISSQGVTEVFETGFVPDNLPDIISIDSELTVESNDWQHLTIENASIDVPPEWFALDRKDFFILSSSADFTHLNSAEEQTVVLNGGEIIGVFSVYEAGTVPESDANYQITSEMTGQVLVDAMGATISEVILDATSYASHIYINSITHTMLNGRDAALVDAIISRSDRDDEPVVTARLHIYFTFVDERIVLLALASEYSQFEDYAPTFRAIAESISPQL